MFLKWSFFTKHLLEIHNSYIILSFRIRIRMKWAVCKLVVVQVCAPVQKKFCPTCPAQVKKCGNGTTCTTCTTYLPLDGSVGTLIFNSFHNITSAIGSLLAELWIQHRTRPVWFKYDNWLFQLWFSMRVKRGEEFVNKTSVCQSTQSIEDIGNGVTTSSCLQLLLRALESHWEHLRAFEKGS